MKRLLACLLLLSVILCFSACGGEGGGVFESMTEGTQQSESESTSESDGISIGEDSDAENWDEFIPFD